MGSLAVNRFISTQRHRQTQAPNGSIASVAKRKGSPRQQNDNSHGGKADHILKNHSGTGVKTFSLVFYDHLKTCYVDRWLQIALTAGIEELHLNLIPCYGTNYNFPRSFLFDGSGNKIQCLYLNNRAFCPTVGFGCLRRLHLAMVRLTGDELECLLSNSLALEQLTLQHCSEIICLKIPSLLQHLSYLDVFECKKLQVIKSKAPNLSSFHFGGARVQPLFGDSLHVKNMEMETSCTIHYACAKPTSIAPNLEALSIWWDSEVVQSRMNDESIVGDSSHLRQISEYRHAKPKECKDYWLRVWLS